jgi:IclR family KDG regulon transcriptional repressor
VAVLERTESARYPIQAVERALRIIQFLADSPGLRPCGITDIAAHLGVSKSTAHRLVSTLAQFNFVARAEQAGKYRLGWAIYQVAHRLPHATGVHAIAQPLMRQAGDELNETVNLAVRYESKMVIVESWGASSGLRVETPRGVPQPLHFSACGKALLMDHGEEDLVRLLGRSPLAAASPRTLTSVAALDRDLRAARRQGYTLDDGEGAEGVRCVGTAVRDHRSEIVAAVSVTGPAQRLNGPKLEEATRRIRRLGLEISRAIGFAGENTI